MTRTIEPAISKYIDESLDRSEKRSDVKMRLYIDKIADKITKENRAYVDEIKKENKKEFFDHMTTLKEAHTDDMKLIKEYCTNLPNREEVREIVREEIKPLEIKMSIITDEIIEHRRVLNKHDKRLTKLENVLV